MSQTTITSFFNSRKRPASEDIVSSKSKVPHIEQSERKGCRKTYQEKRNEITTKNTNQQIIMCKDTKHNLNAVADKETAEKLVDETVFAKKSSTSNALLNPSKSEILSTARKELNLGDIRKKLAGSSRLAELKASADRISKGIKQLKEASDKRNLKEFKSIDVEVPVSPSKRVLISNDVPSKSTDVPVQQRPLISPRKVVVSPIKSPRKVPAYIRHASLATTATSLPLPHHYRFLAELFRGMETVVALLYNRNEKITFNKLKPSVQEMLKRNFAEKHLAQIKHLVPDFYNFEIQKCKSFATSQKDVYDLIVTPNFPNDLKTMNPSVLLERRRYFYDTLLQLVKKHHSQYLMKLDPPMVIPDTKLIRWHPEFELEKLPDVECAKLPVMPNMETFSTAQDVLAKARELFKCNTKMERALEKLAQAKARGLTEEEKVVTGLNNKVQSTSNGTQTNQPNTSNVTILNPALRNLPASLLEKVKAKQAAKALEAMTRSSNCEQKYLTYCRLPDLVRTLRNIFVTERKNVLALNIVLSKLDSSFKANVSASDLQRDIKVLSEEIPELIKLSDIRSNTYLRFEKTIDLKTIISKLDALAEKYKDN